MQWRWFPHWVSVVCDFSNAIFVFVKESFQQFLQTQWRITRGCTHCTAAPADELCLCAVCALLLFIGPTLHLWFLKKRNPKGKVFCKFDKPSEEFTRGYTHCAAPGHELCLSAVCVLFYYSWGLFAIYDFSKKILNRKFSANLINQVKDLQEVLH